MITLAMIASLLMPPQKYDNYPREPFKVIVTTPNFVDSICRKQEHELMLGCAFKNTHQIYIRNDLDQKAFKKVLRHEYGHLNGWKHD